MFWWKWISYGFYVFLLVLILAFCLARWEIQIEGPAGWAKNLPCWIFERGENKTPITGYHFWLIINRLLCFHLPVLIFLRFWNLRFECLLLGIFVASMIVEDFFWFVMNPHFGLKKFRNEEIWWHTKWIGRMPALYLLLILAGVLIWYGLPFLEGTLPF